MKRSIGMNDKEKLNRLEELLDIDTDTLSPDIELRDLEQWDSMAVISVMAMYDEVFEKIISASEVKHFKTIKDIMDQME